MPSILKIRHAHPLEREYEAWIVQGIERYLNDLGIAFAIWAISPSEEATWPADEKLLVGCKIVGLQFKQAKLAGGTLGFNRLKWTLHNPPGQFGLVKGAPEIFYCLPTFINRSMRTHALDHCLFWRPDGDANHNVWYDNPKAQTPYKKVKGAMRWGLFMESLLSCTVGIKSDTPSDAHAQVQKMYAMARQSIGRPTDGHQPSDIDLAMYVLVVKLQD